MLSYGFVFRTHKHSSSILKVWDGNDELCEALSLIMQWLDLILIEFFILVSNRSASHNMINKKDIIVQGFKFARKRMKSTGRKEGNYIWRQILMADVTWKSFIEKARFIAYLNYYMSAQSGDECDGIIKFM